MASPLGSFISLISPSLSLVFLLFLPWRLQGLRKQAIRVRPGGWRSLAKLTANLFLACVQLITIPAFAPTSLALNTYQAVVSPVAAVCLVYLSSVEHRRSARPSGPVLVYISSSLACDLILLTTPLGFYIFFRLVLQLCAKAAVLCAELLGKEPDLLEGWRNLPPEETASIFGRSFVWWMNPILAKGYRNTLINDELPEIDHALSSAVLRERILVVWSQRDSPWLPSVLVKCLLQPGLLIAAFRILLIVFRYAQPALIAYCIIYLKSPNQSEDEGYILVLIAMVVYLGLGFSLRAYHHGLSRLRVMIRGSLVGLIHGSSLVAPTEIHESSTPVALVTTDVDSLEGAVETFYTTWACVVEAIIGTIMLANQVGWVWPLPHLITIVCSRISAYVAKNLKDRQRDWNAATRRRISMTAAVLSSAKSVKMLGIQDSVERQILCLRQDEMEKAARVRWIWVIYNASANALGMFAPVITIVVFAVVAMLRGQALDPETAFPAIATLALVTHSVNLVMTIVPRAVAAYPSFERIQTYLEAGGLDKMNAPKSVQNIALRDTAVAPVILIQDLHVSWSSGKKALEGISLKASRGSIMACCGPVGSGKTTLARAILGEEFPLLTGTVKLSSSWVAYCAQTPWLPNRGIKEVIYGPGSKRLQLESDQTWYRTVIEACCLDQDFELLPEGDRTVVGDGGMNLSGGQRQRVALARAVFQCCEIAVLDDIFSALDGRTEKHVAESLFGAEGLFRKLGTTVFWITSSTLHFYMADHVLVLEAGIVQEQGPWSELKASEQQISKLIHENDSKAAPHGPEEGKLYKIKDPVPAATVGKRQGNGDSSLYGYYFTSAGVTSILFQVSCTASCAFFMTFPQYWMKWWTEDPEKDSRSRTAFYATGYAVLHLIAWISTNGIMWSTLLWVAPTSSIVLHKCLLETVLGASLAYFSTTDTGVILNHFSQDLSLVDKKIASAFSSLSAQIFKVIFQIGVIFAVQPIMSLTLPVCIAVVYAVQKIYLRTSRQMRIIELESQSAVFSSLLETTKGVETIRAFKWQPKIAAENVHVLDLSQRPFYLLACLQNWLSIVLNLLGGGIAVGIILLAVVFKGTTTGAQIGVALNVILVTRTTLLRLVDCYTDLEISLGAVARLREVDRDTPQEEEEEEEKEGDGRGAVEAEVEESSWPRDGGLELRGVSAGYSGDPSVLHDISLNIAPGETVAVCGRTGSGKTSLMLTLLRLLNIESGTILVDGADTIQIPLAVLRQKCFVTVAQDPFFLSDASLQFNLDPTGSLSTQELVRILNKVGLWLRLIATSVNSSSEDGADATPNQTQTNGSQKNTAGINTPLLTTDTGQQQQPNTTYNTDPDTIFNRPFSSLPALSGGQAQLLALARGIAQCQRQRQRSHQTAATPTNNNYSKPIVLLDEVTSSLDAATEATVCDIVEEEFVKTGHTVVMVTHKLGPFVAARKRSLELQGGEGRDGHGEGGGVGVKGLTVVWMKDGRVEKVEKEVGLVGD